MQAKSIGIPLSERDIDIISWINMLKANNQSPRKWIEALILINDNNRKINAGTIYMPERVKTQSSINNDQSLYFGDDTSSQPAYSKIKTYSWALRGEQNEYIPGSILTIYTHKPSTIEILNKLKQKRIAIAKYVRMIIRKNTKITNQPPGILPDPNLLEEILLELQLNTPNIKEDIATKNIATTNNSRTQTTHTSAKKPSPQLH